MFATELAALDDEAANHNKTMGTGHVAQNRKTKKHTEHSGEISESNHKKDQGSCRMT
jgi:hypothetical protein